MKSLFLVQTFPEDDCERRGGPNINYGFNADCLKPERDYLIQLVQ